MVPRTNAVPLGGRKKRIEKLVERLGEDAFSEVRPDGRASYDGRATAEENWFERTGLAYQSGEPGRLRHADSEPVDVRYLDVLPLRDGGFRIYYEARLPDESHELRTELIPPQTG